MVLNKIKITEAPLSETAGELMKCSGPELGEWLAELMGWETVEVDGVSWWSDNSTDLSVAGLVIPVSDWEPCSETDAGVAQAMRLALKYRLDVCFDGSEVRSLSASPVFFGEKTQWQKAIVCGAIQVELNKRRWPE